MLRMRICGRCIRSFTPADVVDFLYQVLYIDPIKSQRWEEEVTSSFRIQPTALDSYQVYRSTIL